jgi:hypothetical protein
MITRPPCHQKSTRRQWRRNNRQERHKPIRRFIHATKLLATTDIEYQAFGQF